MSKAVFKSFAAAFALLVAAATFTQPAEAGRRHHHHHHHGGGSAAAAGIIGLGVGAILGSALSSDRVIVEERYYGPPPRRAYYDDYAYAPRPWSNDWYAYCASKYNSFSARTGTYITYDGEERFCE